MESLRALSIRAASTTMTNHHGNRMRPFRPVLWRSRFAAIAVGLEGALLAGGAHAALEFAVTEAELQVTRSAPIEHVFPFRNIGGNPVTITRCALSCSACGRVRAEPSVVPPGVEGRIVLALSPKRDADDYTLTVHVLTDEGPDALRSLSVRVRHPERSPASARAAARLSRRPSAGLAHLDPIGLWRLTAADIWFDAPEAERPVLDAAERDAILHADFPVGTTSLSLRPDRTFLFDTGRHRAEGHWSVKDDTLPLSIEPPGCTNRTCWKVWALEAVTAETNRLVVDLPDEDEGSTLMIRLDLTRDEHAE